MIRKSLLLLTSMMIVCYLVPAQVVTTYAGKSYTDPTVNWSTTTANLLDAYFYKPAGIEVDNNGVIYVSQQHKIVILTGGKVYNRSGIYGDPSFGAGYIQGLGPTARYNEPFDMAASPDNDIYICDRTNNVIRKLAKFVNVGNGQVVSTYAGIQRDNFTQAHADGHISTAKFTEPTGIVFNGNDMYIADMGNHCIRKISNNTVSTIAGSPGNSGDAVGIGSIARFDLPANLFLESSTSLLVADRNNGKIRRINLNTNEVTTVVSGLSFPTDIEVVNGKIYIADDLNIKVYDGSTTKIFAGSATVRGDQDGTGTNARFGDLTSITYNSSDKFLYVVDAKYNVIKRISTVQAPVADFTADKTSVTILDTVGFTDQSSNDPSSWAWVFTPATVTYLNGTTSGSQNPDVKFNSAGTYSVELTCTNSAGSDKTTKTDYIAVSTTSVRDINQQLNVKIYPNPIMHNFSIEIPQWSGSGQYELYSVSGKLLKIGELTGSITNVETEQANGIYFLKVISGEEMGYIKIVLKGQ
jgi:PKD repeat protein